MKLPVADDALFYADVFVTGNPQGLRSDRVFRQPTLVVDELSTAPRPATAA